MVGEELEEEGDAEVGRGEVLEEELRVRGPQRAVEVREVLLVQHVLLKGVGSGAHN